jgi:FAD/FMN-containing dehydrogenase
MDLAALRVVRVDTARRTAWVGSGATLVELHYAIAKSSARLVGGQRSGGRFGLLLWKHGLAADHVLDAVVVNATGRILDRAAVGVNLFWAIRGGGGGSFGIILSWKLQLVIVPATVMV